jgi:hypothetical protein
VEGDRSDTKCDTRECVFREVSSLNLRRTWSFRFEFWRLLGCLWGMRQELRDLKSVSMTSCEEVYKIELFDDYDERSLVNECALLPKRRISQIASKN